MKTLYLVRHAKSSWDFPELNDHDRPLLDKGIKRTRKIADFLTKKGARPELLMSSTAVRAYETAKLLAIALGIPEREIQTERKLYTEDPYNYLHMVYAADNSSDSLMIVGHNPTITQFVNMFIPGKISHLPTTAVVAININTDKWEEINMAEKDLAFYVYPRMLK